MNYTFMVLFLFEAQKHQLPFIILALKSTFCVPWKKEKLMSLEWRKDDFYFMACIVCKLHHPYKKSVCLTRMLMFHGFYGYTVPHILCLVMTGTHESVMSDVGNWDGCSHVCLTTQRKMMTKKKKKTRRAPKVCALSLYEKYGRYVWPDATSSAVYDWR